MADDENQMEAAAKAETEWFKQERERVREVLGDWPVGNAALNGGLNIRVQDGRIEAAMTEMVATQGEDAIRSAEIQDREVNRYVLAETHTQSFESNLASSTEKKPGLAILVQEDGELRRIGYREWEDVYRGRSIHGEAEGWDHTALGGTIKRKTTRNSGRRDGRGTSITARRYKIEREALVDEIYLVSFRYSAGGSRGNGSSMSLSLKSVERLVASHEGGE